MIHPTRQTWHRLGVLLVVVLLVVGTVPVLALAQETSEGETRAGGVVRVAPGETVSGDLEATGGTVLIQGTVDGNLEAAAGTVVISGIVTGSVNAVAGSVTIEGDVGGDVDAFGGSLLVREGARIGGSLEAAAGAIQLDGEVVGDARLGAEDLTLGPTAVVGGNVEYDAETFDAAPGATVTGTVTRNDDLSFTVGSPIGVGGPDFDVPAIPPVVFVVYAFLANLLLGGVLLLAAPRFAEQVVDVGTTRTLQSGGVGLVTVVGVPVILVVLLLTVVGIPLSLLGLVAFLFALWLGQVYGAYLVGTKALDLAERPSRWGALVLGLVTLAVLDFLPFGLGSLASFVILLLGLGALALALYERSRGERKRAVGTSDDRTEGRPAA